MLLRGSVVCGLMSVSAAAEDRSRGEHFLYRRWLLQSGEFGVPSGAYLYGRHGDPRRVAWMWKVCQEDT